MSLCGGERRKSLTTCVGQEMHRSGLKVRTEAAEVVSQGLPSTCAKTILLCCLLPQFILKSTGD